MFWLIEAYSPSFPTTWYVKTLTVTHIGLKVLAQISILKFEFRLYSTRYTEHNTKIAFINITTTHNNKDRIFRVITA